MLGLIVCFVEIFIVICVFDGFLPPPPLPPSSPLSAIFTAPLIPPRLNDPITSSPPRVQTSTLNNNLRPAVSPVARRSTASVPASAPAPPPAQPSHRKLSTRPTPPAPVDELASVRLGSSRITGGTIQLTEQFLVDETALATATSDEVAFADALLIQHNDEPGISNSMALHDSIDDSEPHSDEIYVGSGATSSSSAAALREAAAAIAGALASDLLRETAIAEACEAQRRAEEAEAALYTTRQSALIAASAAAAAYACDVRLRAAFALFDTDGSGTISIDELAAVMTALGRPATKQALRDMIDQADLNQDGVCDFEEFRVMMEGRL
jgi:hypothetical protein